jgi:3-phosphoshikimate 1-carboxyvinyltransferase
MGWSMALSSSESLVVQQTTGLRGRVSVPGDKSLSHRAVMFGALAQGDSHIRGWLAAGDTEASLRCVQALGVDVERQSDSELTIRGTGKLHPADGPLDFVNAGTGIRLMAGIMAGQPFASVLDGSEQLRRRPMKRIIAPLRLMGADITGADDRAPLTVKPARLTGIHYEMPVASAQVKSAVLLAGLFAEGVTTVAQPGPARDHTERMLRAAGVDIVTEDNTVILRPGNSLRPMDYSVPGDFSSAAFLLVAGTIVPDSDITLTGVNLNPTRTGLLDVLLAMGADITVTEQGLEGGEPAGEIRVRHSALKGIEIGGEMVVRMIDEFPALMVAALCAEGHTLVRDAQELRVKETDRLAVMTTELRKLGAEITETEDGFIIDGPQQLHGARVDGHDDHRIAMSLTIAGLAAEGQTIVDDAKCAGDSFPGFAEAVAGLGGRLVEAV